MTKRFYLTTPLYYVNAAPHIGHSYTNIAADCLARYHRLKGEEVFFLTGTDEHGEKILQAATAQGFSSPKEFADKTSQRFRDLWKELNISYDYFIRTTDEAHKTVVRRYLEALNGLETSSKPQKGTLTLWYCVPCETYYGIDEVHPSYACPNCQRPVNKIVEENFYLSLEKHRDWLKKVILENDRFILPVQRRNEVLGLLEKDLPDLCMTRPKERVQWGIEIPFSSDHVTYVWFDALLNYISALDWPEGKRFHDFWEEAGAVHLVGKDILKHHAIYWPIILHVLKIKPPKMIFAHGWWKVNDEKMSKSKGNAIDPLEMVKKYGVDPYRYFLLREVPFGQDGTFSEEALVNRLNNDLANDLGNLVFRTLTMVEKYFEGKVPEGEPLKDLGNPALLAELDKRMDVLQFDAALTLIWEEIRKANRFIEESAPWKLARAKELKTLSSVLRTLLDALKKISLLIYPFIPETAEKIWSQLGIRKSISEYSFREFEAPLFQAKEEVRKGEILYQKVNEDTTYGA